MHVALSFDRLKYLCAHLSPSDLFDIEKAFFFMMDAHRDQIRADGSPYSTHPLAVAEIVAQWHADRDTVIAALLHDVIEDTQYTRDDIADHFGDHVAVLVDGMTKFSHADLSADLPLDRRVETLRKLLDVMRSDMRSIIIKLADRLHNMQTLDAIEKPEKRRRIAKETLDVYHKIALHLGMRSLRHQLADLSVPFAYDDGIEALALRDRLFEESLPLEERMLHDLFSHGVGEILKSLRVEARNVETFYQLWKKHGNEIQHTHACIVSIVVDTDDDCYRMLRMLHTLYRPLIGQFRDYIAAPSDAGYQSLHTTVLLPDGQMVECRVRTSAMERQSSHGILLWLFDSQAIPPSFEWLERSEELDVRTKESSAAFWEALQSDVFSETMSVVVNNERISVPYGSTVLDAVYAYYGTHAGNTRVIVVRGLAVTFSTPLREDDVLTVRFGQEESVDFTWLRMISTQHARLLIIDVLKKRGMNERLSLGANLIQREMDYFGLGLFSDLSQAKLRELTVYFNRSDVRDILILVGEGALQAKDIVFFLFPEQSKGTQKLHSAQNFRLKVRMTDHADFDNVYALQSLIHDSSLALRSMKIDQHSSQKFTDVLLIGKSSDRFHIADFLSILDRQSWVSSVQTVLSTFQRAFLIFSSFLGLSIILADVAFLPHYQVWIRTFSFIPLVVIILIPIIPVFGVNYYLLRLLRHYIVRMRSDRWFLGIGLLLNVLGLLAIVFRTIHSEVSHTTFFPLIAAFTVSLFYIGITFFQADRLLSPPSSSIISSPPPPFSTRVFGYFIRFVAIIIWGGLPIYIRYSPVASLSPLFRIFLTGVGVLIPFVLIYIASCRYHRIPLRFRIPYDVFFWLFVFGQITYAYTQNITLLYTSSTNLQLFTGFGPVIALFVASLFWRRDIPYLRAPQTMLWIFTFMIMSSSGSALLIYSSTQSLEPIARLAVIGDLLAILATFFDVILTIGQIQYIKSHTHVNSMLLNIHVFLYFCVFTLPILLLLAVRYGFYFIPQNPLLLLYGIGAGFLVGVGLLLNYEALKRIDGYISYMLYNFSIVITFFLEAYFLQSITVSPYLFISAALILGASFMAELLNMRLSEGEDL